MTIAFPEKAIIKTGGKDIKWHYLPASISSALRDFNSGNNSFYRNISLSADSGIVTTGGRGVDVNHYLLWKNFFWNFPMELLTFEMDSNFKQYEHLNPLWSTKNCRKTHSCSYTYTEGLNQNILQIMAVNSLTLHNIYSLYN